MSGETSNGGGQLQKWVLIISLLVGGGGMAGLFLRTIDLSRESGARAEKISQIEREVERLRVETMPRKEIEANFEAIRRSVSEATWKIDRLLKPQ